jgi:hypothetical protein
MSTYLDYLHDFTIFQEDVDVQGARPPIVLNFNPSDLVEDPVVTAPSQSEFHFLSYDPTVDYDPTHQPKMPRRDSLRATEGKRKGSFSSEKRFVPTPPHPDEVYKPQMVDPDPPQPTEEFRTRILISQKLDEINRKAAPQNQQNYLYLNEIPRQVSQTPPDNPPSSPGLSQQLAFTSRTSSTIKRNSLVESTPLFNGQEMRLPLPTEKKRNSISVEPPKMTRRGSFSEIPINYDEKRVVHIHVPQQPLTTNFINQQLESVGLGGFQPTGDKKRSGSIDEDAPKKKRGSNPSNLYFHYYNPTGVEEPRQRSTGFQPEVFHMFIPQGEKKGKYSGNQSTFHMYQPNEDPNELPEKPTVIHAKEKRLTKKRQKSNSRDQNRMNKAISEEFLVLDRTRDVTIDGVNTQVVKLLNEGDINTCTFSQKPTCTCSDFGKPNICKHLYFCTLKLFGFDREHEFVYQKALVSSELDELLNSVTDVINKRNSVCVICCDPVNTQKSVKCENCKCVVHEHCYTMRNRLMPGSCWCCNLLMSKPK